MPLAAAPLTAVSNWSDRLVAVKLPSSGPLVAFLALALALALDVAELAGTKAISLAIALRAEFREVATEETAEESAVGAEPIVIVLLPFAGKGQGDARDRAGDRVGGAGDRHAIDLELCVGGRLGGSFGPLGVDDV